MKRRYYRGRNGNPAWIFALCVVLMMVSLMLFMWKWKRDKAAAAPQSVTVTTGETDAEDNEVTAYVTFPSVTLCFDSEETTLPAVSLVITAKPERLSAIQDAYTEYVSSLCLMTDLYRSLSEDKLTAEEAVNLLRLQKEALQRKREQALYNCLLLGEEEALSDLMDVLSNEILQFDKVCEENPQNPLELSQTIKYNYDNTLKDYLTRFCGGQS